jgi:hypothetical protein
MIIYVPKTIGGIVAGSTFSKNSFMGTTQSQNWPLTEVLREILYPYIEPVLSLALTIYMLRLIKHHQLY